MATERSGEGPKGQAFDDLVGVEIGPANGPPSLDMEVDNAKPEARVASSMALHVGDAPNAATRFSKRHRSFTKRHRDQDGSTKPIGELLVDSGWLKRAQLEEILRVQATSQTWGPRKRFGQIARELGLVDGSRVDLALARQFDLPSLAPSDRRFAPELLAAWETSHAGVEILRGVRERIAQT